MVTVSTPEELAGPFGLSANLGARITPAAAHSFWLYALVALVHEWLHSAKRA